MDFLPLILVLTNLILYFVKDDPNTVLGKIKLFFFDVGEFLKSRFKNIMNNKFSFYYLIYCLLIHFTYNYILPNIYPDEEADEEKKNDIIYYFLFYIMMLCATLIENKEKNGRCLSYDSIPFFLSNLIWSFYMIIKSIINIAISVKNHATEIIYDLLSDYRNFKISSMNLLRDIFSLPFNIAFNSLSIIKSESNLPVPIGYFNKLPAIITSPAVAIYNSGVAIYDSAVSSFGYLKSGVSKIFFYTKTGIDLYKLDNYEKLKVVLKYLFHKDKKNFSFLTVNAFNFIFVIITIIILIAFKLISNFISFRKEMNKKRKIKNL